jgi:hypothetical protein
VLAVSLFTALCDYRFAVIIHTSLGINFELIGLKKIRYFLLPFCYRELMVSGYTSVLAVGSITNFTHDDFLGIVLDYLI